MSRPLFASCFFFAAPGVTVPWRGDLGIMDLGQGLQRMALCIEGSGFSNTPLLAGYGIQAMER
jgi:hypothetical protein